MKWHALVIHWAFGVRNRTLSTWKDDIVLNDEVFRACFFCICYMFLFKLCGGSSAQSQQLARSPGDGPFVWMEMGGCSCGMWTFPRSERICRRSSNPKLKFAAETYLTSTLHFRFHHRQKTSSHGNQLQECVVRGGSDISQYPTSWTLVLELNSNFRTWWTAAMP